MSSIDKKAQHERLVFLGFTKAARMQIDEDSVEVRNPPEPDIRCSCEGHSTYFELGRLLDQGLQRLRLKAMRIVPQQVACDHNSVGLPERDVLRAKLSKLFDQRSSFGIAVVL